jgi:D-alanyl-D-alanine carboxypeptidase (penicillin-binding protein 5/6)
MKDFLKSVNSLRKKFPNPNLILIPLVLAAVFALLSVLSVFEKGRGFFLATNEPPIKNYEVKKIPVLKKKFTPSVTAEAVLIMDKETGTILYSKNQNLRFSPASTTKIMTSLVGLDHFKPDDVLEVKEAMREGSILGLFRGQKMKFEELLYAMMLPSANDAAYVIAQNYPGGVRGFVKQMNKKSDDLNLSNTHFDDPAGLLDVSGYTTAVELARIASTALENPLLAQVVSTPQRVINDELGNSYLVFNKNRLLGIDGVNGVKTGFTEEAGDVLVTSKKTNDNTILMVVLRSKDRFADTYELLNLTSADNLTYLSIRP